MSVCKESGATFTVEHVVSTIQAIWQEPAPEDGLRFAAESVTGERIIEMAQYEGVRARFTAHLGTARVPMQVDIGFGDPLVPGPSLVRLPTILDLPAPEVQGYSRESAIAEKLQIMVHLGEVNSRMKDFYQIWLPATKFGFDDPVLAQAIRETFRCGRPLCRGPQPHSAMLFPKMMRSGRNGSHSFASITCRRSPLLCTRSFRLLPRFFSP